MPTPDRPTHTHASLAKALGVTVTTIKSYRRKFPEFWKVESRGKPIRFPSESLELCRRIKHHFGRGLSVEETRSRLAEEFEAPPRPEEEAADTPAEAASGAPGGLPEAACAPAPLARIETLMDGLFSLQNRTHSLLAELLAKLDTLADHLAAPPAGSDASVRPPAAAKLPTQATGRAARTVHPATASSEGAAGAGPGGGTTLRARPDGSAGRPPRTDGVPGPAAPPADSSGPEREPVRAVQTDQGPPQAFLDMPVVVRTPEGEFLGMTSRSGKPFTLAQFADFLAGRGREGGYRPMWLRQGQDQTLEWTLRLIGQGQVHDHHFHQAVTPRGNTVARFASLSVGGKPASEAALQAFLRQLKETQDQ